MRQVYIDTDGQVQQHIPAKVCTGIAARWCPVCGTCTCDRDTGTEDPKCPLHGIDSTHANQ